MTPQTRSDVDPFSNNGYPITSVKDLTDFVNYLLGALHKAGAIKDVKEFLKDFDVAIENKGKTSGTIQVKEY